MTTATIVTIEKKVIPWKVLDLFCGLGGWSIGFHREGFQCVGVDLVDLGYPYELIQMDIWQLAETASTSELLRLFGRPDVVVASPPCEHFSQARGKRPSENDATLGMILVDCAIGLIRKLEPKYWIIENVRGAVPFIGRRLGKPRYKRAPFYLWGKFPSILVPEGYLGAARFGKGLSRKEVRWSPMKSWRAARLPLPLTLALAKGIRASLENPGGENAW